MLIQQFSERGDNHIGIAEAMTANMEKREAEFNKMVDVKKFNESDS